MFHSENIDYDYYFSNATETIIFLHGWGGNKNSFDSVIKLLKNKFNILVITIPTISNTNLSFDLFDYANLVSNIAKSRNINECIVICHSFGFRIACILQNKLIIKKMIVTGGAGLKNFSKLRKIDVINSKILYKNINFNFLHSNLESSDYKNLCQTNKITFNKILNLNCKNLILFSCPILLFWGNKDKETPLKFAKIILKVNNAKLIIVKSNHFAYLSKNSCFNHSVLEFLSNNMPNQKIVRFK